MENQHLLYAGPLISLALLWVVTVVTPGQNFFITAQLAASNSRKHGLVCALGVATIFAATMPSSPPAPLLATAVAIMTSLSVCWYSSVALVFASSPMSAFYSRCRKGLDRFAGTCYLLFGAHLLANR